MDINASINIDEEQKYKEAAERLVEFAKENREQIQTAFSKVNRDFEFDNKEKADRIYNKFKESFDIDELNKFTDDDILNKFLWTNGNDEDFFHQLENGTSQIGEISGNGSYTYKNYNVVKDNDGIWRQGDSKTKAKEISPQQALQHGKDLRAKLKLATEKIKETINKREVCNIPLSDFANLDKDLFNISKIWTKKYYHILFQKYFSNFFSTELQQHILYGLGIQPAKTFYERSCQLAKIHYYTKWENSIKFCAVCMAKFGNSKIYVIIDNNDNKINIDKDNGIIGIKNDIDNLAKSLKNFKDAKDCEILIINKDKITNFITNIEKYEYTDVFLTKKGNIISFDLDNFIKLKTNNDICYKLKDLFIKCESKDLLKLYNQCYWSDSNTMKTNNSLIQNEQKQSQNHSLNTILYGPPGTGKTYHTLYHALSIIDNKEIDADKETDYESLKRLYDEYVTRSY